MKRKRKCNNMTDNEWIQMFMVRKNIILKKTMYKMKNEQISLSCIYDLEEIMQWDERVARKIKRQILENIKDSRSGDSHICPWCIYQDNFGDGICDNCRYGKRNGICNNTRSTYAKVCRKLGGRSIFDIVRYEWLFGRYLNDLKED